jgi:hypothetical protein
VETERGLSERVQRAVAVVSVTDGGEKRVAASVSVSLSLFRAAPTSPADARSETPTACLEG